VRFRVLLLVLFVSNNAMADEAPSMEFLTFLADYTDEDGNWDGPGLDESAEESGDVKGEEE